MKLVDYTDSLQSIALHPDTLWADEFDWSPVVTSKSWGVGGSLIIQKSTKTAGRSVILKNPQADQGWVYRDSLLLLTAWAADVNKKMVLWLEKPTDTRTFVVVFDENNPIKAVPVKGWADHNVTDPYTFEIHLIMV